jgi:hypothetical protein
MTPIQVKRTSNGFIRCFRRDGPHGKSFQNNIIKNVFDHLEHSPPKKNSLETFGLGEFAEFDARGFENDVAHVFASPSVVARPAVSPQCKVFVEDCEFYAELETIGRHEQRSEHREWSVHEWLNIPPLRRFSGWITGDEPLDETGLMPIYWYVDDYFGIACFDLTQIVREDPKCIGSYRFTPLDLADAFVNKDTHELIEHLHVSDL